MTDRFTAIVAHTIAQEGGDRIVEDPHDRGGVTKYGIASKHNPGVDVRNLSYEGAVGIYRAKYWEGPHIDRIKDNALAAVVFDLCVMSGDNIAVKSLQKAANIHGASLAEDGALGPKTAAAVNSLPAPRLINSFAWLNGIRLARFAIKNPSQQRFLVGWLNRLHTNTQAAQRGLFYTHPHEARHDS